MGRYYSTDACFIFPAFEMFSIKMLPVTSIFVKLPLLKHNLLK